MEHSFHSTHCKLLALPQNIRQLQLYWLKTVGLIPKYKTRFKHLLILLAFSAPSNICKPTQVEYTASSLLFVSSSYLPCPRKIWLKKQCSLLFIIYGASVTKKKLNFIGTRSPRRSSILPSSSSLLKDPELSLLRSAALSSRYFNG